MVMTRATFLMAVSLVVTLIVVAAGIGGYIAVRQNAPAQNTAGATPAAEARMAAGLYEPDGEAAAGVPGPGTGIAVDATEQIIEPAIVSEVAAAAEQQAAETARARPAPQPEPVEAARPAPQPAPSRPAARPPAPAPTPAPPRREPSRPAPVEAARPAPQPELVEAARPAPQPEPVEAARPAPQPEPALREPARQTPSRASRDLPPIDGWRRVETPPAPEGANVPTRDDAIAGNLPPLAAASLDPPTTGAEPPPPVTEELVVPADSVIGLQIDTFVTTDRAEVEDDVQARVTRDVTVSRRVAIPAGSLVTGSVVMVERGGKLKGAARLGVRFHTVVFDDGVELPIVTETVYREGRGRGRDNAARIGGGAVAGAILGAIFGGGRGAAIGGAAGAAGGTAAAAAGDAEPATLPAGTTLTVRLSRPTSVSVER